MDYRKRRGEHSPFTSTGLWWSGTSVARSLVTSKKLSWSKHTKIIVKRAQQQLFTLMRLKRFGMGPQIFKLFYSTIESILTSFITA